MLGHGSYVKEFEDVRTPRRLRIVQHMCEGDGDTQSCCDVMTTTTTMMLVRERVLLTAVAVPFADAAEMCLFCLQSARRAYFYFSWK